MKRTPLLLGSKCILLVLVFLLSVAVFAAAIPNWAPNTAYATGALVMFNGVEYQCIQGHTSEVGWEPPNVPALWQPVSGNPGPTPTATAPPKPTATPTASPTPNGTPTATPKPTATATPKPTPTATPKPTPTATPVGGGTTMHNVYITFYGWFDNSPPGNAIAFPKSDGNPTAHNVATAGGTFSNPSSFASDAKDGEFKVGQLIYVPFLQKYFINEDECTGSGPPVAGTGNCEADWEKKKEFHVDLWLGGNPPGNETDSLNCEDSLTTSGAVGTIIVNPPSNEPVDSTPIFNSNTNACEKLTPF